MVKCSGSVNHQINSPIRHLIMDKSCITAEPVCGETWKIRLEKTFFVPSQVEDSKCATNKSDAWINLFLNGMCLVVEIISNIA